MTKESSLWTCFQAALPGDAHVERIENRVGLGTPDVNLCLPGGERLSSPEECIGCDESYCSWCGYHEDELKVSSGWDGWIELKVQEPPKRKSTKFKIEHFTMEQRQWLVSRHRAGGLAYALIQAGNRYLFLRGDVAAVWVGQCTLAELVEKCEWSGGRLEGLVDYLRST